MKFDRDFFIDLGAVSFLGLVAWALRYPALQARAFDIDEAFQLFIAAKPTLKSLFSAIYTLGPQQYPLDYVIGFFAEKFTRDIYTLRLLPIAWGLCSVVLAYAIGKLAWNRLFGFLWAWLMSISLIHIFYSQTFRQYSLIVCLSLATILFFLKAMEDRHWLWAYGFFSVLYQVLYPFAFIKTICELVYVLIKSKRRQPGMTAFLVIQISLCLIPAALFALKAKGLVQERVFFYDPRDILQAGVWLDLFRQYGLPLSRANNFYIAFAALGVAVGFRSKRVHLLTELGLATAAATLGGIFGAVHALGLFFHPRHAIVVLPIYLGFVAAGATAFCWGVGIFLGRLAGLGRKVALIGVCSSSLWAFYRPYAIYLADQSEAALMLRRGAYFLQMAIVPRDTVIFSNPNLGASFLYFYDSGAFFKLNDIYLSPGGFNLFRFPSDLQGGGRTATHFYTFCSLDRNAATFGRAQFERLLKSRETSGGRVWLVYSAVNYRPEPNPFLDELKLQDFNLEMKVPGIYLLKM